MTKNKNNLLGYFLLICGLIVSTIFIYGIYIGKANEVLNFLIGGIILVELGMDELLYNKRDAIFKKTTISNDDMKVPYLYYRINSGAFTVMKWLLFSILIILISYSFIFKIINNVLLIVTITFSLVWFIMNVLSKLVYLYYKNKN